MENPVCIDVLKKRSKINRNTHRIEESKTKYWDIYGHSDSKLLRNVQDVKSFFRNSSRSYPNVKKRNIFSSGHGQSMFENKGTWVFLPQAELRVSQGTSRRGYLRSRQLKLPTPPQNAPNCRSFYQHQKVLTKQMRKKCDAPHLILATQLKHVLPFHLPLQSQSLYFSRIHTSLHTAPNSTAFAHVRRIRELWASIWSFIQTNREAKAGTTWTRFPNAVAHATPNALSQSTGVCCGHTKAIRRECRREWRKGALWATEGRTKSNRTRGGSSRKLPAVRSWLHSVAEKFMSFWLLTSKQRVMRKIWILGLREKKLGVVKKIKF